MESGRVKCAAHFAGLKRPCLRPPSGLRLLVCPRLRLTLSTLRFGSSSFSLPSSRACGTHAVYAALRLFVF